MSNAHYSFFVLLAVGARAGYALAYETRVGSPLDFQRERVSAPSCLRALNRIAQAGRRAALVTHIADFSLLVQYAFCARNV
ncbi:hypothetical protein [Gardnerella sp. 2492-Sm]|uniref:hypothetical protein n=1 Tax=unclassified Gardnerella TaxID=2628112 RepID=UPI003CFE0361